MAIVRKDAIKKLKTEGKYTLEYTLTPEVVAHITYVMQADNTIKIRAYLLSQNPRQRIKEVAEKAGTAHNFATLEVTTRNLCTDLIGKLETIQNPPQKTTRHGTANDFAKIILAIPDISNPSSYNYLGKNWSIQTTEVAVSYYARTFGRFYQEYGVDADSTDFEAFRSRRVNEIYAGQYKGKSTDKDTIHRRRELIYDSINSRFTSARAVQQYIIDHHPEIAVPATPIPVSARTTSRGKERVKAISMAQYIKLCTILQLLCGANVAYAYAVLLEIICGARIGESCAPLIGDFEIIDGYGRYYIGHQIDNKGQRTDILKNVYSYRYVFFGKFVVDLISHRISHLKTKGYTMDELAQMPLAFTSSNPFEFVNKAKASSFLRGLLGLVGCDEPWLEQEAAKMYAMAAVAGDGDDLEVCAHTLRSTIATFFGNGGLDAIIIDAILGHKNEDNRKKDYASWETAREICAKIERCIYLGSLYKTLNPAYNPVVVDESQNYQLGGNMKYQFEVKEDMYVALDLQTMEPGSTFRARVDGSADIGSLRIRTIPDDLASLSSRPILQPLLEGAQVEQWIKEASEIDLSPTIYKYGGQQNGY